MSGARPGIAPAKVRVAIIGVLVVLAWLAMGYRLFQIQVVQASDLADAGLSQRLHQEELAAQRGKIFDREGELLALTVDAHSIYAVPGQVEEPRWVAQEIGSILGVDSQILYDRLTSDRHYVYIKRQLDAAAADEVLSMELAGVYTHLEPTRIYPAGGVASHVTGFVDIDGNGLEGIELVYNQVLRGEPGNALFERGLDGTRILQGISEIDPAIPGHDLITTIDLPLQYQAQKACLDAVDRTNADSCWVVALHVETGEVLAMAGAPVFDPQSRQTQDSRCDELEDATGCRSFDNFAVRGIYEPGSTQKLITVAAAIDAGVVSHGTVIPSVGDQLELKQGACSSDTDGVYGCFNDFVRHPTTDMSVTQIFSQSSNVGTIKVAQRLGEEKLIDYIKAFGLGAKTGIDYTVEASGLLGFDPGCDICWASASIGYAVAVTPIQMAAAYAAIANDGVWTKPRLVSSIVDVDGEVEVAAAETRRVVSPGTARVMRELLGRVVDQGTGGNASVDGYRVGGKTGTARRIDTETGQYTDETRASFVGMAPINDPKVVVAVLLDNPDYDVRTGGLSAAPVFSEVMEQALHRLGATPDNYDG